MRLLIPGQHPLHFGQQVQDVVAGHHAGDALQGLEEEQDLPGHLHVGGL